MIRDEKQLEVALEQVIGLLNGYPDLDSAKEARLGELLDAIKGYQPHVALRSDHPLRARLRALQDHLDAFHSKWADDHPKAGPHWMAARGYLFPG